MKKILIPTDFSKCADAAVEFAVHTAELSGAELTVTHIFEFYPLLYGDPAVMSTAYPPGYREDMEKELLAVKNRIMAKKNVSVAAKFYDATVQDGVLQAVKDTHADLVVMGTHGLKGFSQKLFGSQTAKLAAGGGVPLLAIPCNYRWQKPAKIVLATNTFEKQGAVLGYLLDFVKLYRAELHVVVFTDEEKEKAIDLVEHEHQLNAYTKMIQLHYAVSATAKHIYGTDFEEALNNYIEENAIDILAMVTHKRGLFGQIFNPSTTKQIIHHLKVPLLSLPSKAIPPPEHQVFLGK